LHAKASKRELSKAWHRLKDCVFIAQMQRTRSAAHRANATSPRRSYVNVERGNAADKSNGRNINASFPNNSNVPIEVVVFIFYSDEIAIDVKTGLVTRHKN
jgi:hypothetical protein